MLPRLASAFIIFFSSVIAVTLPAEAAEPIRLAADPALSPDGSTLAFSRGGDIWTVPIEGGQARRLTWHEARESSPKFSPDGKKIAFLSDREDGRQVYVMPAEGGTPDRLTHHTAGYSLHDWTRDGRQLLVSGARDHFWRRADRFFLINAEGRSAEKALFDDYGADGCLSPDGKRLLFTREGVAWWRKGYVGSQDSQIWSYDLEKQEFSKLLEPEGGARWPIWRPDGEGFYYVGIHNGALNLREHDLESGEDRPLTDFEDDSVVFPCLSRDGSTLVFRHLFDFYRFDTDQPGRTPEMIEILDDSDAAPSPYERNALTSTSDIAFSQDGLEVAFIAGGDLWVMDTELREPKRITNTPEEESSPFFSPDGDSILFISDAEGQCDIWRARRADEETFWWLNQEFRLDRLTKDDAVESQLTWSPEGSKVAFVRGQGDLWVMDPDGKNAERVLEGWNTPQFDWSPDGQWIVFARSDNDFNRDVWVVPIDGSREPFNLSRHPENEGNPTWSPDGKVIAFTGRRFDSEEDLYLVYLRKEDDEQGRRDRTLEKALEKMAKARGNNGGSNGSSRSNTPREDEEADDEATDDENEDSDNGKAGKSKVPEVVIDFEGIHERLRRVAIPNSSVGGLFWSHDGKKLAFVATVEGRRGTYTIEPPDDLRPKLLTTSVGSQARWISKGNQILWRSDGVPATLSASGSETKYPFRALQEIDREAKLRVGFDLCWRAMRDGFYDENLGNRNWDAIRRKYIDIASKSTDPEMFGTVVSLMLGELNGSHLGFSPRGRRSAPDDDWRIETAHLGVRFDPDHNGPGLKVRDVLPGGPAGQRRSRIEPGEQILAIDGQSVDPEMDLTAVLNGPLARDIVLRVRDEDGDEREVTLRPISYGSLRSLLYDKWVKDNRAKVEELSDGQLGYLHIAGMNASSFNKFQEELYSAGAGRDGLVIDVRENGGGSTADRLLTALTQPVHAITVPRGGGPGYPNDRTVFASWGKPIVVLCNQNSFSNAEIFSHAIKTLGRGPLVGVTTAGGVISTGSRSILDLGSLRMPGRGWYLIDTGEDMELNGAEPHHIVWPEPGEWPSGKDSQLAKAVEVLLEDVEAEQEWPRPELRKASERLKQGD
ncbi:S41 family peptidase [soil metagenome]